MEADPNMGTSTNDAPMRQKFTIKQVLRFVIPSLIGAFFFMCPVMYKGDLIIPITILVKAFNSLLGDYLVYTAVATIVLSGVMTIIGSIFKPKFILNFKTFNDLFNVKWYWLLSRVIAMIFCLMVVFGFGPEIIISKDTGSFILYDLLAGILAIAIFAGGLLPCLVEFGLMDYVGTFLGRIVRPIFKIPGRAAVDCISSWLGDTSIAVLITNQQYESGYYTAREACVIATTFSAVSVTFALVVVEQVGFINMFFPFYGIVCLVGVVCAVIVPRIPPLSWKKDEYYIASTYEGEIYTAPGYSLPSWAFHQAIVKANGNGYTVKKYIMDWLKNSLTVLCALAPMIMFIGTSALIMAYYTPILQWLGKPFLPLLYLLQIPEPQAASTTMVAGFADMFIPSVIAAGTISSPFTRFFVAVISITQLLFLSENGSMILSTRMPLKLIDLFVIFLERTIISAIAAAILIRLLITLPPV